MANIETTRRQDDPALVRGMMPIIEGTNKFRIVMHAADQMGLTIHIVAQPGTRFYPAYQPGMWPQLPEEYYDLGPKTCIVHVARPGGMFDPTSFWETVRGLQEQHTTN